MALVQPKFRPLLQPFSDATLHGDSVVCGFWPGGEIGFVNDAYLAAAARDMPDTAARWGLGASYFAPMGPLLEPFYRRAFEACLRTGLRWDQTYFCNTPEHTQHFSVSLFPLEGRALLSVHTLASLRPYRPEELAPSMKAQGAANSVLTAAACA